MKPALISIFSLLLYQSACAQFSFIDDSTDMRVQSFVAEELDKRFKLDKDNDFELRLWIFPKLSDSSTNLSLFILANKNGIWNARFFQNAWSKDKMNEVVLRKDGLEKLWEHLNENGILKIPKAWTLIDKDGEQIIQSGKGTIYSFELLAKQVVKHYAYECPKEFSNKYNYIPVFKSVAIIVQYIIEFLGTDVNLICAIAGAQHRFAANLHSADRAA